MYLAFDKRPDIDCSIATVNILLSNASWISKVSIIDLFELAEGLTVFKCLI